MILICTNNECKHSVELNEVKIVFNNDGSKKRDDSACPQCGERMIDPETENMDYSNVRMEKPFSDRDIKRYYDRQRKETGKKKTSSN